MESLVKILGAFIDTLVLNVYPTDATFEIEERRIDPHLQEELMLLKEQAQENEEDMPTRFVFMGKPLLMKAKGGDGFNWIMQNRMLKISINRSTKAQILAQVRCSSEYLWRVRDLGTVLVDVHQFLMSIFGDYITLHVSSCDLAVDVTGLDFGGVQEVKQHFVSRAQLNMQAPFAIPVDGMIDGPDLIRQRWGRITGLPFGARNAPLSALIYDKTHEIKYQSPEKAWFRDLWLAVKDECGNPVWDEESPVWRIEIRYKRQALNEMLQEGLFHGIDNAYDLEERLPGLWSYAVGHTGGGEDGLPDGWLRYILPTEDTNRSRWPVHPDWQVVQSAFAPVVLGESEYEREEREKEELLQLVDEELEARPWKDASRMVKCHTSCLALVRFLFPCLLCHWILAPSCASEGIRSICVAWWPKLPDVRSPQRRGVQRVGLRGLNQIFRIRSTSCMRKSRAISKRKEGISMSWSRKSVFSTRLRKSKLLHRR